MDAPAPSRIVITAHGISDRRRRDLISAGKQLIDTTCPLVTRVHRAAQEWAGRGAFVVVIGQPDHVEIQGIIEDLESFAVVATEDDVKTYAVDEIAIISQTTFPLEAAARIRQRIEALNPRADLHWIDTICQPTKDRQQALQDLLKQVEAVVVVGGRNSNNTRRLVDKCRQEGVAAFHIQAATELDPQWFIGFQTVGLTAGTSTLPETFHAVRQRLESISETLKAKAANERVLPAEIGT